VKICVLGSLSHNNWFAQRLLERGFAIDARASSAARLHALGHISAGLLVDNILVDTDTVGLKARHELARCCAHQGLGYSEWAGHWLIPGVEQGFQLFTGSDVRQRDLLLPVLDALAPVPGAWLYCGPAGAGYYAAKVFDALTMAYTEAIKAVLPDLQQGVLQAPDWQHFFRQQQQLAQKILQFSELYLSLNPQEITLDPWQQLQAFALPPRLQGHFSANLAHLMVLALGRHSAVQEIFEHLLPMEPGLASALGAADLTRPC
jgi:hypothetical protein